MSNRKRRKKKKKSLWLLSGGTGKGSKAARQFNYSDYLKSDRWKNVKRKVYPQRPCECCEGESNQLHHKTYRNFGHEKKEDLMWVCEDCHTSIHKVEHEFFGSRDKRIQQATEFVQSGAESEKETAKRLREII